MKLGAHATWTIVQRGTAHMSMQFSHWPAIIRFGWAQSNRCTTCVQTDSLVNDHCSQNSRFGRLPLKYSVEAFIFMQTWSSNTACITQSHTTADCISSESKTCETCTWKIAKLRSICVRYMYARIVCLFVFCCASLTHKNFEVTGSVRYVLCNNNRLV